MKVINRSGIEEDCNFGEISSRIKKLVNSAKLGILKNVDADVITKKTIENIHDNITTSQLDEISARIAVGMATTHPNYETLASRLVVSNLQKSSSPSFFEASTLLYNNYTNTGEHAPLISEELYEVIKKNHKKLDKVIIHSRDFLFDYFGFMTLYSKYLLRNTSGKVIERPQYLWLRVALGLNLNDLPRAIETYNLLSQFYYIQATPTLFNAGTNHNQLSSCFLLGTGDSMKEIYKTISDCAMISKYSGGIGVHINNIRSKGSVIKGTGGISDGIIPMLRVYNQTARYSNQGGGKRKGSFAIYLEVYHPDIMEFLDLRKNTGEEELRARDLFYALWVPDLFMKAVENDEDWYLFSEDTAPNLSSTYGEEFENLYREYIKKELYLKKLKAREIWEKILVAQIENGLPYICYKDAVNKKSNYKHYGIIKSSNLCSEITLYSDDKEYAVCNLATLSLPKYIENGSYNFQKLAEVVKVIVKNLNNVIDINFYPVPETELSNKKHRPIGIGIQGLANTFFELKYPFDSVEAKDLNKKIMETIQFSALQASMEEAKINGSYETFEGSPISQGLFQHNLWGLKDEELSGIWDWKGLREDIKKYGLRNSTLTALPPTASTSQILGNYESFEPSTNNFFIRETLSGNFPVINKYLINDLIELKLWNEDLKNQIISHNGSIQSLPTIPDNIKKLYRNVWEYSQKVMIDLSIDRAPFVCQSQSLNIHMKDPTIAKLSSMAFYSWRKGLKTGSYYIRTLSKGEAQKFTIEPAKQVCNLEKKDDNTCMACSG